MYTPGPCNLLSLNAGLNGQVKSTLRFCMGIASAMLLLFLLFGYTGSWLVNANYQIMISSVGSVYIAYLALKIISANLLPSNSEAAPKKGLSNNLNFRSGVLMQLLNPKSFVAIIPIVTVQFPAAEITGQSIIFYSLLLSCLAFGAPSIYLLMGAKLGKLISHVYYFRVLSILMALVLLYVAIDIGYNHAYLKWP
jgi:threonine/homoserine/homoserine lactone efflux protein